LGNGTLAASANIPPVWEPNKAQWRIIWLIAALLILGWPPQQGRSLGMKAVNWLVDPSNSLPTMPSPLPFGLDDNGDAVTAHDAEAAEYYSAWERSLSRSESQSAGARSAHRFFRAWSFSGRLTRWRVLPK